MVIQIDVEKILESVPHRHNPEDKEGMMRLARYLLRAPIAVDRIDYDRDKGMVNHRTDKFGIQELDVLDFIARLTRS